MRITNIIAAIDQSGAVSSHLAETHKVLAAVSGWEVAILARRCGRRELPARLISGVAELLIDRDFLSADLLIYHFDGWDPLFDAIVVGNGHARQAVFVHPLKPVELVAPSERHRIALSSIQLNTLRQADRLWPISPESAALLAAHDFDRARIDLFHPEQVGAAIRDRAAALLPAMSRSSPDPAG